MPRIFKHLEAGCLQVNVMSTGAQINQLKYIILYYKNISNSWPISRPRLHRLFCFAKINICQGGLS